MLDPTALLTALGPWMLAGVAVFVFIESGVLFPFLPGDSLLVTAAILAPQMGVPRIWLVVVAVCAAFLGDQVGFWLGVRFGRRLFHDDARVLTTARLHATERFFDKYGALSLVLGRFVPIIRTYVPLVAGVSNMRYRHFLPWNAIGGATWVVSLVTVGSLLGGIPMVTHNIDILAVVIVVVSVVPIAVSALRTPAGGRAVRQSLRWVAKSVPVWPGRLRTGWLVGGALVLAFCIVLGPVLTKFPGNSFDVGIARAIDASQSSLADALAKVVEHLFGPFLVVVPILILMVAYGWAKRSVASGLFAGGMVIVPWVVSYLFKFVANRPRPNESWVRHVVFAGNDASYPSGHTAIVTTMALFVVLWAWRTRARWLVLVATVVVVGLVCWARVYAGTHYPSDAAVGVLAAAGGYVLLLGVAQRLGDRVLAWPPEQDATPEPDIALEQSAARASAEPDGSSPRRRLDDVL